MIDQLRPLVVSCNHYQSLCNKVFTCLKEAHLPNSKPQGKHLVTEPMKYLRVLPSSSQWNKNNLQLTCHKLHHPLLTSGLPNFLYVMAHIENFILKHAGVNEWIGLITLSQGL